MVHGQLVLRSRIQVVSRTSLIKLTWTSGGRLPRPGAPQCLLGWKRRTRPKKFQLPGGIEAGVVHFVFERAVGRNGAEARWHGTIKPGIGVNHGHKSNWLTAQCAGFADVGRGDAEVVVVSESRSTIRLSFASLNPRHQYHRVQG